MSHDVLDMSLTWKKVVFEQFLFLCLGYCNTSVLDSMCDKTRQWPRYAGHSRRISRDSRWVAGIPSAGSEANCAASKRLALTVALQNVPTTSRIVCPYNKVWDFLQTINGKFIESNRNSKYFFYKATRNQVFQ